MDPHLAILFPKEKNMVAEDEGHHLVEFQDGIHAPYKEASERVEFLQIVQDDFKIVRLYGVVSLQHRQKIVEP